MTDRSRRVPTGLDALDRALSGFARHADARPPLPGGFSKGQVIEVWGPPASGKTTFGYVAKHVQRLRAGAGIPVPSFLTSNEQSTACCRCPQARQDCRMGRSVHYVPQGRPIPRPADALGVSVLLLGPLAEV